MRFCGALPFQGRRQGITPFSSMARILWVTISDMAKVNEKIYWVDIVTGIVINRIDIATERGNNCLDNMTKGDGDGF